LSLHQEESDDNKVSNQGNLSKEKGGRLAKAGSLGITPGSIMTREILVPFPREACMMRWLSGVIVLAVGLIALGWFIMPKPAVDSLEAQEKRPEARVEFAADRAHQALKVSPAPFDGERAMEYLKEICKIGPRISGTDGMKEQQELIKKHFEDKECKVDFQRFKAKQISQKEQVEMANIIVSFWPERPRRVIVCSHYDTRPIADQEPDMQKWRNPFLSANDGGSGVAFLMELGRHLKELNINTVGVDFVFFDGEEYIWEKGDKYFFGSEQFASTYKMRRTKTQYIAAILLDMIAGKGARFPKEPTSMFMAGPLVESFWKTAAEQKSAIFVNEQGPFAIDDDHVALNKAGIPAIDLLDFSYMNKHWHKLSDTPAACSAEPMVEVSKVLTVWLQRVK
jgi:hypothetical protein